MSTMSTPYKATLDLRQIARGWPATENLAEPLKGEYRDAEHARASLLQYIEHLLTDFPAAPAPECIALRKMLVKLRKWAGVVGENLNTQTLLAHNGATLRLTVAPVKLERKTPAAPTRPREGSLSGSLLHLEPGGVAFLEFNTPGEVIAASRRIAVTSRMPGMMRHRKHTCHQFTAVGAHSVGDVRYLLRVQRTK
jgi:hypothetical protein